MSDTLIPWKTLSATVTIGQETEGWDLASLPEPWPEGWDGARTFVYPVVFESPFYQPPVISIGLTGFDIDQSASARIKLGAAQITAEGFSVEITTWLNTRVYSVDFSWIAMGA
jgi:hypothetical protein